MDRQLLADRYVDAWNRKDLVELLELIHPQASYYDAFWGESCSGEELRKYFRAVIPEDSRWYRRDQAVIATPNGLILRYVAFDAADTDGEHPLFQGAEIFTVSDGLIMTISDLYCDPDAAELIEAAEHVESRHALSNIGPLGLSGRISGRIKRRLAVLATESDLYLDPSVTVTILADEIGCSVMHLFHVLEEELGTTFNRYINECRARRAAKLIAGGDIVSIDYAGIATATGFDSVEQLNSAMQATFGVNCHAYARKAASELATQPPGPAGSRGDSVRR